MQTCKASSQAKLELELSLDPRNSNFSLNQMSTTHAKLKCVCQRACVCQRSARLQSITFSSQASATRHEHHHNWQTPSHHNLHQSINVCFPMCLPHWMVLLVNCTSNREHNQQTTVSLLCALKPTPRLATGPKYWGNA